MVDKTLKCKKCGKNYPITEVRYFGNTDTILCHACIEEKKAIDIKVKSEKVTARKKYKCSKCKYSFFSTNAPDRGCPYCGSQNIVLQELNGDAERLIKESATKAYDL
jgi:DNA-directed RNA polymerase subunit RPC12/RpoP